MPATRPLLLCLFSASLVLLAVSPTGSGDAIAQVPGVRCVTPVGACIVPAIPYGSICFCGNFQGTVVR